MHLTTRNVNTAFRTLVDAIHSGDGYFPTTNDPCPVVRRPSRNGSVLVIDEPVTITYTCPRERVLFNAARDANPFFHLYEALWMLAGRNDVAPLAYYSKRMKDFSDDGVTLNGAYGYRWRHAETINVRRAVAGDAYSQATRDGVSYVDQLDLIVQHLKADPTSRRAVLQMWNVEEDLLKVGLSKDVCCNLSVMFSLRTDPTCPTCSGTWTNERAEQLDERPPSEGGCCPNCSGNPANIYLPRRYLDMTVTNRSNDLVWGLLGANYVHFSVLLEYMAARLGAEVGKYHHFSNNLHVYDDPGNPKVAPWEPEKWLGDEEEDHYQLGDRGYGAIETVPLVSDPEVFERELPKLVETYSGDNPERQTTTYYEEPFLARVAQPMMWAFFLYKTKNPEQALRECTNIAADDWRVAAEGWLKRRTKTNVS